VKAAQGAQAGGFHQIVMIEFAKVLHALRDVGVGVHDAGHHPFVREVDDRGILRDGDARADLYDLLFLHEDDLIPGDGTGGGIDQISSADGDRLGPDGDGKKQAHNDHADRDQAHNQRAFMHFSSSV
jgi:hypothetical protein